MLPILLQGLELLPYLSALSISLPAPYLIPLLLSSISHGKWNLEGNRKEWEDGKLDQEEMDIFGWEPKTSLSGPV